MQSQSQPSKNPTVSLVIAAYNEEKYLGDCLAAVIASGGNFAEIIVVDNASTDRTRAVAEEFFAANPPQEPAIKIVTETKKGASFARQRGYAESAGDIVAFIDADTRMPHGWHGKVVHAFSNDGKLVCLSGPFLYHDVSRSKKLLVSCYWNLLARPIYKVIRYMAIFGNVAVRRDVMEKMGGVNTSIEFYGDDTDLARRAYAHGTVRFDPHFFMWSSARRLHGQGIFNTAWHYGINFISEVVIKRPVTKGHKDIR